MRALVVDDSQAMRVIIRKVLKDIGFDVVEAQHGKDALARLAAPGCADFDVALIDWNMPEMNGLELVRAVRHERRFDRMRIMMVTTEIEGSQVVKALDAGANEYLMKPFTRAALVDKLALLGFGTQACTGSGS